MPDFGLFSPGFSLQIFLAAFTSTASYALFQSIVVCNFKDNKWTKLEKMTKNLVSGLILAPLTQILVQKFVFVDFTYTRC